MGVNSGEGRWEGLRKEWRTARVSSAIVFIQSPRSANHHAVVVIIAFVSWTRFVRPYYRVPARAPIT